MPPPFHSSKAQNQQTMFRRDKRIRADGKTMGRAAKEPPAAPGLLTLQAFIKKKSERRPTARMRPPRCFSCSSRLGALFLFA